MRNLALQGEVRHILPTTPNDSEEDTSNTKIVAVIQNTNTDHNIPISLDNFDYGTDNNSTDANTVDRPKQPPVSFIVTSDGYLSALDVNDELVWRVDLEKVVAEDEEEEDNAEPYPIVRSQWFYAASFLQENPPDENADDIINLAINEEGLHITCLSHAGHVVSVSIDATNNIANSGGIIEEGSECIGSFDNGLSCGGWSIDGEVLALVTFASDEEDEEINENKDDGVKVPILMTMNTQYEVLSEVRLEPTLVSDAITFCWRPDSSSLAISTMDANVNDKPLRRIRTYHRTTLQLLSLSKEEDGSGRDVPNLLPVPPAWAPAGCSHYVGAVQSSRPISMKSSRARITMQVAFMEPNGLRHTMCKIHSTVSSPKTDKEDVHGIAFNLEGDLLAVTSKVTTTSESSEYGKVQLYHRNNYHWYLKYELRYDGKGAGSSSSTVSNIKFSTENPYQLMVALNQGGGVLEWREYTFRWESSTVHYRNHQSPSSSSSSVLAMAVDGKKLNFTPLDKAIIPPPMYASSLELQAPVVGITSRPCFYNEESKKDGQVDFIIALSDGKLALLQCDGGNNAKQQGVSLCPGFQPPSLLAIVDPFTCCKIEDNETDTGSSVSLQDLSLRDITIIDDDDESLTIIALMGNRGGKHTFVDNLIEIKISLIDETCDDGVSNTKSDIVITSSLELEGRALRIVNWADTVYSAGARGSALLELVDGSLLEYSKGGVLEPCEAGAFLEPCPWISGVYDAASSATIKSSDSSPEDHAEESSSDRLVIGLSNRYRLYCGERLLSSASSSFDISLEHQFIAHVTIGSQPQLRFLPISSLHNFDSFMGSDDQNMALDGYEPRSVERGARLVAIFPSKPSVVIQMPRGNLEAISPRALVLPYIMVKIQEDDFLTALDIMRRQRVDMNLIVDLDPSHFLDKGGAEKFICQIEKIDNINLFLSSLIDVDTTLWKYPIPSWIGAEKSLPLVDKVNKVCTKMRQVMLDAEKEGIITSSGKIIKEGHFLLPILSTFAKESPPKLEEALSLIKNSASQVSRKSKSVLLSEKVQSSIQYLAFLANYELLFDTSIGMYDFELAKAVARHSQMDPKVYLPMLKRWRELPESTARYEVDVKLKRYESALHHLVASSSSTSNQEDEVKASNDEEDHITKCLKFIEEHGLHKLGLRLFRHDKDSHRQIMISLGERLLSERKSEEALTIFLATTPRFLGGAKRASRTCGDWKTYFTCCAEDEDVLDNDQVSAMAESISSKIGNMKEQRENYASAATILLEYGEDVSYAIDMLISAHMWSEGRRIANRYKRADLVKKVADGAVSYARTCIEDIAERSTSFEEANKRYAEVIVIRREAIREAEEAGLNDLHHDDSASMFSMQSTASNTSLRSSASGASVGSVGSIGSVASVSTVISVGANSTFSFTGDRDTMKHKSKFNNIGRDKKKKKKQRNKASRRKMKPGSEEELTGLVETLTHACPDDHYVNVISETITFLLQVDKKSMATLLFESYKELSSVIEQSQVNRMTKNNEAKIEREKEDRKEGRIYENVEHPCEKDINAIKCLPLNKSVESTLSFLL